MSQWTLSLSISLSRLAFQISGKSGGCVGCFPVNAAWQKLSPDEAAMLSGGRKAQECPPSTSPRMRTPLFSPVRSSGDATAMWSFGPICRRYFRDRIQPPRSAKFAASNFAMCRGPFLHLVALLEYLRCRYGHRDHAKRESEEGGLGIPRKVRQNKMGRGGRWRRRGTTEKCATDVGTNRTSCRRY